MTVMLNLTLILRNAQIGAIIDTVDNGNGT